MFEKIFDAFVALIFTGMTAFTLSGIYNFVKREAILRVGRGLSSTYTYSRRLTGEHFDWER